MLRDDETGGLDPESPTWYIDNYGLNAETLNRIDLWYESHPEYNIYTDKKVWATNYGNLVPRNDYSQIVQTYAFWKVMNGQGDLLGQQMGDQAKAFLLGTFHPAYEYFEEGKENSNLIGFNVIGAAGGSVIALHDGIKLSTNDALDAAKGFLGEGYIEVNSARWVSADGLRQVRMGLDDLSGEHAGGSHINFEIRTPIPGQPGRYKMNNMHIYYNDDWD